MYFCSLDYNEISLISCQFNICFYVIQDVAAGLCGAEQGTASTEQPSPVSVLDTTFYRDDSPSPVKKISFDLEGQCSNN